MGNIDEETLKNQIAQKESGGKYTAQSRYSSAAGKYQFLWGTHGNEIKEVTGVSSKEDFLKSPQAQEQFMNHWVSNVLAPRVSIFRQEGLGKGFSDNQLAMLIHLEGAGNAHKKLVSGTLDQATGHNLSPLQYMGVSGAGGGGGKSSAIPAPVGEEASEEEDKDEEDEEPEAPQAPQKNLYEQVYGKFSDGGDTDDTQQGKALAGAISGGTSLAAGFLQDDQSDRTGIVSDGLYAGKGALSGAGTGATIGAAFGPGGALLGAGAGALIGGITGLVGAGRKQAKLRGEAITNSQTRDANINNRAVTTDLNPYGTQMRQGGYTYGKYEDGDTVQGLAQIPAQAQPQDVAPQQPATSGQPQGQPQQNMIDIEKGELRIDPKSGKILQEYTGINPKVGTRYQRHNPNPDGEPAANFVPADPGQFIVTVKDAKRYKDADLNNDTILKGTIMRNIINNKEQPEQGYHKGSYVIPKFADGGGTGGTPDWKSLPLARQKELISQGYNIYTYKQAYAPHEMGSVPPLTFPKEGGMKNRLAASLTKPHETYVQPNTVPVHPATPPIQPATVPVHPGSQAVRTANTKAIQSSSGQLSPQQLQHKLMFHQPGVPDQMPAMPGNGPNALQQSITNYKPTVQPTVPTSGMGQWESMMGKIGKGFSDYGPSLYNIGRGLQGGEHENHIAPSYNPLEGQITGNLPQNVNFEAQRQEALRQNYAAGQDIDQRTNSSTVARSNKNNVFASTQNQLGQVQLQNAQYNNQLGMERSQVYNNLGQQRIQADQYATQYNQGIDNVNAQNRAAASNSLGTGISQVQQTSQNNQRNSQQQANDQYMFTKILPLMYPGLQHHMGELTPPGYNQ